MRSLGELVQELCARPELRFGRRRVNALEAIERALADVVGADAPQRCRPGAIMGTTATLECRTNAVAQRLSLVAPDVLRRVCEILANDDVQAFRVTVEVDGWQATEP